MKYDFKIAVLNLDDKFVPDADGNPVYLNKVIAHSLASQAKGDPVKLFDWSMDLWKTGFVDLDKAGRIDFEKFIKENENFSILTKGRIMEILNKQSE